MSVSGDSDPQRVSEVRDALDDDLAYHDSVLSALQTLEEKGFVRHEAEGPRVSVLRRRRSGTSRHERTCPRSRRDFPRLCRADVRADGCG
jgi:hypothetical protein